ncbi:C9orf85-like protein [Armadillidium nasatum]|uniref:C9orf85-like protein n=1 Tax=Armadillidium nasatum TaxID=96803 RepID=A0A5N5TC98_9CRUS|nr:C9orf85-like protein [Armadillidium nasatum]
MGKFNYKLNYSILITMSSQRGNVKRTRGQKYQNKSAFQNSLHDTSRKTKEINKLEILEVCKQCKDVIEWKIKYKKYKPLTQPKTCSNCHLKSIKFAYHTLCDPCGKKLDVCCKCRQPKEILHKPVEMKICEYILRSYSEEKRNLEENDSDNEEEYKEEEHEEDLEPE